MSGQRPSVLSVWRTGQKKLAAHRTLAVTATLLLGLGVGVYLDYLSRQTNRPPTVRQLISDLQKKDNPFHNTWEDIWTVLPNWFTGHCGLLKPESAVVRRRSAPDALAACGSAATPALPNLVKALEDLDADVRFAVLRAFQELGPVARPAGPILLTLFNDPAIEPNSSFPAYRAEVASALAAVAPENPTTLKTLLAAADSHSDSAFRAHLIRVLGNINPPPPSLMQRLQTWLKSSDASIYGAAIAAIHQIGPGATETVPDLLALFDSLSKAQATNTVGAFSSAAIARRYGIPMPAPASPVALAVPSPPPGTNTPTTIGFWRVGIALTPPVFYSTSGTRLEIIEALGSIGPAARAALPMLTKEATNPPEMFRHSAILAKWQIDQDTPAALDKLIADLRQNYPVRAHCHIVEILGRMGSEAVPAILVALESDQHSVRWVAVRALGSLGPAARSAMPRIEPLLHTDPKFSIRIAAQESLKRIEPNLASRWRADVPKAYPKE